MNKDKLITLSQKLSNDTSSKLTPSEVYAHLHYSPIIKQFLNVLTGFDIILLSFLISDKSRNKSELFDTISNTLFSFTTCEVVNTEPDEECDDCDGNGQYPCDTCDADGKVECKTCWGRGDIRSVECVRCNGHGETMCPKCDDGFINCYSCDGLGYRIKEGYRTVDEMIYYSYNLNLFNVLELKDKKIKISNKEYFKILNSEKILGVLINSNDTEELVGGERGDIYFMDFNSHINPQDIEKGSSMGYVYDNNLSYLTV